MSGITRDEALVRLNAAARNGDTECAHADADDVLLDFIDDDEIREAYERVDKWYA